MAQMKNFWIKLVYNMFCKKFFPPTTDKYSDEQQPETNALKIFPPGSKIIRPIALKVRMQQK